MHRKRPDYLSYLIRLRRVDNGGHPLWRITVETPGAAQGPAAVGNLEALVDFLQAEMAPVTDSENESEA